MRISETEQYFAALPRYPKIGGTPEAEIRAYKKKCGYINLDNPEHKRRYASKAKTRFNPQREDIQPRKRKEAKKKYKQALINLDDGTAVLRVKHEKTFN